jgi:hypothetical protein
MQFTCKKLYKNNLSLNKLYFLINSFNNETVKKNYFAMECKLQIVIKKNYNIFSYGSRFTVTINNGNNN